MISGIDTTAGLVISPAKAISITAALKRAGVKKGEEGRNGRIGYTTLTEGFYVEALDKDYVPVYGYRNGKKSTRPTSWKVRNKKDTRFRVKYEAFSTSDQRGWRDESYRLDTIAKANRAFETILTTLAHEGYRCEVDFSNQAVVVIGKVEF